MVFIAYNYEGFPISVVNSLSEDLALAFWQGRGLTVHSHGSLKEDFTPLKEHPTGIYEFIKTENVSDYDLDCRNPKGKKFVLIKK